MSPRLSFPALLMMAFATTAFGDIPVTEIEAMVDSTEPVVSESYFETYSEEDLNRDELNSSLENWESALSEDETPDAYDSAQLELPESIEVMQSFQENHSELGTEELTPEGERIETVTADEE